MAVINRFFGTAYLAEMGVGIFFTIWFFWIISDNNSVLVKI